MYDYLKNIKIMQIVFPLRLCRSNGGVNNKLLVEFHIKKEIFKTCINYNFIYIFFVSKY